jgi:hypothetical protein
VEPDEFLRIIIDDLRGVSDDAPGLSAAFAPLNDPPVTILNPFDPGNVESALLFPSAWSTVWVAAWEFDAEHIGPFLGFPATGRKVRISGISIYDAERQFMHRSIDWTPVLAQIGVALSGRPFDEPPV